MQKRAAGMASSRAAAMGLLQDSHTPKVPSASLARACSTSSRVALSLLGQRLGLAPLGRDLARVGEVGVVVEAAELFQLAPQIVALGLQVGAQIGSGHVGHEKSLPGFGEPGARMSPLVLLAPELGRDPRVHLGRRDRGVPEQLLHHPDVGAVVEHVGGAGVAQHVRGQPVAEPDPGRRSGARWPTRPAGTAGRPAG